MPESPLPPVLAIGGHDPIGGAGLQADIEAIAAVGGHAATAVTCLTVQDTRDVKRLVPTDPTLVTEQAEAVLADLPVMAIKIGLIGNATTARGLGQLLGRHPTIPVVLDPVLVSGGGTSLADDSLQHALMEHLLPQVDLLTPNSQEARRLTGASDLDACAQALLESGCRQVLITGTHEKEFKVINTLYGPGGLVANWEWERLPGEYHGSGCTLAAAIAALLARGFDLVDAVYEAQEYTWQALAHGYSPGRGQCLPDRLYHLTRRK